MGMIYLGIIILSNVYLTGSEHGALVANCRSTGLKMCEYLIFNHCFTFTLFWERVDYGLGDGDIYKGLALARTCTFFSLVLNVL